MYRKLALLELDDVKDADIIKKKKLIGVFIGTEKKKYITKCNI